ncbi:hypothetical protein CBS101457_001911 [Exobasidium rhododendri]|nr:hypothetical protein CBS101457_001911 [Exobasidium rhododendri]
MLLLSPSLVILSLTSLVAAAATLTEVRKDLQNFEDGIIALLSARISLGTACSREREIVYAFLSAEQPFAITPPRRIFSVGGRKAPPYLFYSSNKTDQFGKTESRTDAVDDIFHFLMSSFASLPLSSSSSTLLSRASVTAALLSLTSERVALGSDVAKAKIATTPALMKTTNPAVIRTLLTNHTQENVVRQSVREKSAAISNNTDAVGLFDILINITTDVEVAYVLNAQ